MTDIITTQTQEEIDALLDGESIIVVVQSEPSQITTIEQINTAEATIEQPVQQTTVVNIGPAGPTGPMGIGFQPDVIALFVVRVDYDAQPEGFSFLAYDLGEVFFRVGETGWSTGIPFTSGQSAYDIAVAQGFVGTEQEWLTSLNGTDGLSAYELSGFAGTEAEWIASLQGVDGLSAYEQALANGFIGTEQAWLASLNGTDGLSAYEQALANGFIGTEQAWLDSLKGESFTVNATGLFSERSLYDAELQGFSFLATDLSLLYFKQAVGWSDGVPFGKGDDGLSAYEVAVSQGFIGTEQQWLASLQGAPGEAGESFTVDAVGLFSERSTYDSQVAGFSFLATDTSLIYFKLETVGSWTEGIPFGKGEPGESGVYTGPNFYVSAIKPVDPPINSIWIQI